MQIGYAALVYGAVELSRVAGELHSVAFYHIGRSACRRGGIIAVLCHLVARTGYDKACRGGDVERVLTVASRTYYVNVAVAVEDGRHTGSKNAVAETEQLVHCYAAHLYAGKQSRELLVGIHAARYAHKDVASLLPCEAFMIEYSFQ